MPVRIFGLEIRKAAPPNGASPVLDNRGWWPLIREPYTGAWQRNDEWTVDTVLAFHAVYACVTLIASDIGKLRAKLVEQDANGIWSETKSAAFSPVLRRPNHFQNHIQFKEWWITSKLLRGNAYALKERDARGVVQRLYLLDPNRVKVLVTPQGDVYYELARDNLAGIETENLVVPASEIIHDRMNCLFHPLVGVSPIFASGTAAHLGREIETSSSSFFGQGANPGGLLVHPQNLTKEKAQELSDYWNANYQGDMSGRVAVLFGGLTYQPMRMTSVDAQLIEQLKWTAETVCSCFHVPPFKLGIGSMPAYNNAELLNQIYYSDCLQSHIESMELALDEGLGIGLGETKETKTLGVELDLEGLLRMDTATQVTTLTTAIGGGLLTPNEARSKMDQKPLKGGDTVYLQQQNYAMYALHERDQDSPFSKPPEPSQPGGPNSEPDPNEGDDEVSEEKRRAVDWLITDSALQLIKHVDEHVTRHIEELVIR